MLHSFLVFMLSVDFAKLGKITQTDSFQSIIFQKSFARNKMAAMNVSRAWRARQRLP